MKRPEHLPDYTDPPLDEVVIGVQFAALQSYTPVHAKGVWDMFKDEFPQVLEQPMLDPQFETFGGMNVNAGPQFVFGAPPAGSRLWFISPDESHLVQFQKDRFVSNWRRRPNTQPYPHFEGLADAFQSNLLRLSGYAESALGQSIEINQAEVTYINVIPVGKFSDLGDWFNLWNGLNIDVEGLSASFSEVIKDKSSKPCARMTYQLQSVFASDGSHKAYTLSLSFKGKPEVNNLESAMLFLARGRDAIVSRFGLVTTQKAQEIWGKIK